ncbi:MAG: M48 family metalloprotease [Bacteroidetes bacterium]|nr:M48 family metalloprotease [Bacteroidota bacterium]
MNKNISFLKRFLNLTLILSLLVFIPACDDNGVLPVFQTSYDLQLGAEVDAQIKADPRTYPILNNASATQYLQNIVNEIIKSPEMLYSKTFVYKVTILDTNIINAFATPGGYIYVYTGLLKYVESEAELAAILAHEIAHADRRHSVQTIQKQYGVSFLVNIFLDENTSEITNLATNVLTELAFLENSRSEELEADHYSFKYLLSTKWYPGASKYFFSRMLNDSQSSSSGIYNTIQKFLSTHPTDKDRIDAIDKLLKENNIPEPTEDNLFKNRFAEFKASL